MNRRKPKPLPKLTRIENNAEDVIDMPEDCAQVDPFADIQNEPKNSIERLNNFVDTLFFLDFCIL